MKQSSHLTEVQLVQLKSFLETRLKEAKKIVREQQEVIGDARLQSSRGPGDSEASFGNQTILESEGIIGKQAKYIQAIENALNRMRNGTYGFCLRTGKPIPYERLVAAPHATTLAEEKAEKKRVEA